MTAIPDPTGRSRQGLRDRRGSTPPFRRMSVTGASRANWRHELVAPNPTFTTSKNIEYRCVCRHYYLAVTSATAPRLRVSLVAIHKRATEQEAGARPGFLSCASRSPCYFRASSCPVHEPITRRILPRSTAPWFDAAKVPSTCFAMASPLAVAPSKAAQFL
jgi:hypothetical protein